MASMYYNYNLLHAYFLMHSNYYKTITLNFNNQYQIYHPNIIYLNISNRNDIHLYFNLCIQIFYSNFLNNKYNYHHFE